MPTLVLTTNVKLESAAAKAFALEFSKFGAATLDKPEKYISITYNYNETLSFGGSHEPAFNLVITSLGNITPALNEQYSKAFFGWFEEKLNVHGHRGYITFYDPGNAFLGHNSTTFETIFGAK